MQDEYNKKALFPEQYKEQQEQYVDTLPEAVQIILEQVQVLHQKIDNLPLAPSEQPDDNRFVDIKGKPLIDEQKENNRIKSKVRCRVEHIFGFVTNSMNDFYIQSIGFQRAKGIIGLINLVYNMCRYEQIVRLKLLAIKK